MYLSYVGIRVTNLERSLALYSRAFGLQVIRRGDNTPYGGGPYVLLHDPLSGQRLELNWYPPGSPYDTPYAAGEGLDHVAFRVDDVDKAVQSLLQRGLAVVSIHADLAEPRKNRTAPGWFKVAYVKDPDGNWIELYQHAEPPDVYDPDGY